MIPSRTYASRDRQAAGNGALLAALAGRFHQDLLRIARRHCSRESRGHELEPAALLNEAFLRLARQRQLDPHNRSQVLAVASTCMRRVLIDDSRHRRARKRPLHRVDIDDVELREESSLETRLCVREAVTALRRRNPRQGAIVELRFFDELGIEELAHRMALSVATVKRELRAGLGVLRAALAPAAP